MWFECQYFQIFFKEVVVLFYCVVLHLLVFLLFCPFNFISMKVGDITLLCKIQCSSTVAQTATSKMIIHLNKGQYIKYFKQKLNIITFTILEFIEGLLY